MNIQQLHLKDSSGWECPNCKRRIYGKEYTIKKHLKFHKRINSIKYLNSEIHS